MEEEKQFIKDMSDPLNSSQVWLKLLGVLNIIQGVIAAMTIIGIIIAWLPIWMGILLFRAGSAIESARMSGDKTLFLKSQESLKTYFIINGVITLIMIVFMGMIFMGGTFFARHLVDWLPFCSW